MRVDEGGGSQGVNRAQEEQRQAAERAKAEEARRAAEEARKAAEAARKAAEEAAKAAAEAAKAAAQAKKDLEATKKAGDPTDVKVAEKDYSTAKTTADAAQKKADELTAKAKTAAETAKTAMTKANDVAKTEGKQPPYTNEAIQNVTRQDVFEAAPTQSAKTAEALAKIPEEARKKLGLTDEDLKSVTDAALPHIQKAAEAIQKGDVPGAIDSLKDAAKAGATQLAERAIMRVADKLPDYGPQGVAKQLLTDPAVVHDLVTNPQAHEAISDLAKGNIGQALEKLNQIPSIRDNVVDQIASNPAVQGGLEKLGLTGDDLKKAGGAVSDLIDAGLQASQGKYKEALDSLAKASKDPAAIEVLTKAVNNVAKNLPDSGAGGIAKSLLTNKDFVQDLLSNENARAAVGDLVAGKPQEALTKLAGETKLLEKAVDALKDNPDFKKGLDKLGLSPDDVKKGVDALPDLLNAAQAAAAGDMQKAIGSLADAAHKAPEAVAGMVNKAAKNLPEGPAKALLSDEKFVKELFKDADTAKAVKALAAGDVEGALKSLAKAPKAAEAAIDALAKDPSFKKGMDKLGLTTDSLKKGVDALPDLVNAGIAASKGDYQKAIGSLADAAQKAPEVTAELINNAAKNLPAGPAKTLLSDPAFVQKLVSDKGTTQAIKDLAAGKLEDGLKGLAKNEEAAKAAIDALATDPSFKAGMDKLGLTADSLKAGVDALPDLVDAAVSMGKGDVKGALGHLADAAQKAPEVAAELVNNAAKNLPEGPAKALLSDKAFVQELFKDPSTAQAIKQFADGDVAGGLRSLAKEPKAAEAAIDALAKDPSFKSAMDKLGLTADSMKKGVDALPDLVEAGLSANKGDWQGAIGHLADAAQKAPEVVADAVTKAAQNLPAGPAKTLLSDRNFVEKLAASPNTAQAIKDLAAGDVVKGIKGLVSDPEVAKAAVDALYKDPSVKAAFDKLGLTPDAVKQGVDALPDLVDAATAVGKGDWQGAIGKLADAAGKAPELVAQAINKAASNLPPGLAKNLLSDPTFVQKLVGDPNTTQAIKDFAAGNVQDGLKNLAKNQDAANAAIDVLAKDPSFKAGMDKLGVSADDLKAATDALPDLVNAGIAASQGKWSDAISALGAAAKKAPELISSAIVKAAGNLPDSGAGGILKSVLTNKDAVQALLTDDKLQGAIGKLAQGDLSALKDVATSPALGKVLDALSTNPTIKAGLDKLGLNVEDLKAGAKALPDLVNAAKSMAEGDFQSAFSSLKSAALNIPPSLVEKAIKTGASHLPDKGPAGLLKNLLTDDKFVHELVTNPDLHASFQQAMNGDLTKAVEGILGNKQFASAAAEALAKNPDLMQKLSHFGIQNAQDLAEAGGALVDLMQAGEAIAKGDVGKAISELGEGFQHLPDNVKSKLINNLVDKLGLPQGAKDVVKAVVGALGDKEVRGALGDALQALKNGDVGKFVSSIADAGRHLTTNNKEAAISLLNAMHKLPGSLGKFFDDPEFNRALVESGAATQMFDAVEKMAKGDVGGALGDVMQAAGKLLTQEPHFEVLGEKLPIGMKGIENMARLMGRFIDMLPDKLKEKIFAAAGKAAGGSLIKSIPIIGNIFSGISAIGSGKDLVDSLGKEPKDWVDVGLNAAQFALDLAGTIPGLGNVTSVMGNIVGVGKVIKGATDLITDVRDFQKSFVGF